MRGESSVRPGRQLVPFLVLLLMFSVMASATDVGTLLAEANQLYDRWGGAFDYASYEADLRSAIDLYEQVLPSLPEEAVQSQSFVLVRLARADFELAEGYTAQSDAEPLYTEGRDYALSALRLDPQFVTTEADSFRAALSQATDVKALFWYGNTLGRVLGYHALTALMGGLRDVQACFVRAAALDPEYLAGAPLRSLGSFYAQVPGFLGGDMDQADAVLQQAMAVSSSYLENAVDWADFVLRPQSRWETLCETLNQVLTLSEDPEVMAAWPFYNERARQQAQELLDAAPCGS